ncbi:putative ribonuclease H protein [Citrus sinensis]|uniref:Ribonuclease H protein n=1 Tax=Citrus sinensis TaxID=2711 RepID=A0ACB8KEV3_CITSI|nr:putative ribonuclease H protein [Citrus sinensis]
MQALGQAVEDEEIKNVIFSMKALKAPGIGGLHALFYQTQWHVVGKSVCSLIKGIFNGNEIPKELNKTLIVLVPKSDNPISLKLFRPISLCPVIYKTITKLLANRLKSILPDLIGPTQTSFIPGRHITENIVVAQEVIHLMRRKKGRIGQMAIKTTKIPFGIREKIDQACRRFIWSGAADKKKISLVKWDTICQLKPSGGLGLKQLNLMNDALLMKIGWVLIASPNSLWVKVLLSKYGLAPKALPGTLPTKYGSYMWKAVGGIWHEVLKGIKWDIGNGNRVRFWWDNWVTEEYPLYTFALQPIRLQQLEECVARFITVEGTWNWRLFENLFPHHLLLKIAATKPPSVNDEDDYMYWAYSKSEDFTTNSAYRALSKMEVHNEESFWRILWQWRGPQHIKTFLWVVGQNRLKTKAELFRRHIVDDMSCARCGCVVENTLNVLRDCPSAKHVWSSLIPHGISHQFFSLNLRDWALYNLRNLWKYDDGARKSSGLSSTGGLIRNCYGEWIIGFGMNVGVVTIIGAELWGLYQGLCLAWDNGIRQLQVEVDSLCVTRLVADDEIRPNAHASLVRGIKELLNRTWQVQVKHVYRESNFAADFPANSALSLPVELHLFNSLPLGAGFWIRHDCIGVSHPRFVLP